MPPTYHQPASLSSGRGGRGRTLPAAMCSYSVAVRAHNITFCHFCDNLIEASFLVTTRQKKLFFPTHMVKVHHIRGVGHIAIHARTFLCSLDVFLDPFLCFRCARAVGGFVGLVVRSAQLPMAYLAPRAVPPVLTFSKSPQVFCFLAVRAFRHTLNIGSWLL